MTLTLATPEPDPPPPPVDIEGNEILDYDLGYGQPMVASRLDPAWWVNACTYCNHRWDGTAWEPCVKCAKRLEGEPVDDWTDEPDEPGYDDELSAMLVDWGIFWDTDHNDADWLAEPVIPAKRSTALFAPGGTGKSLLALYIAAALATGGNVFGRPTRPAVVLYLDFEMTADDLSERLDGMGYGPETDLGNLHYALLPSLPPLDDPEGGKAVVRLAELVGADIVIIDTFGRAVHGDENDADTVRSFYRWTGMHLKHAGRAFLRVDHAGKDVAKGQRGSSAKNDDVDVVWQMTAGDAGAFKLTAKKRRMGWVPMTVELVMVEEPTMRYELANGHTWPKGTAEIAKRLDELEVPVDCKQRDAREALKAAGKGARAQAVSQAIKYRKERSATYHFAGDITFQPVGSDLHEAVIEVENATREDAGWPLLTAGTTSGTNIAEPGGNQAGNQHPPKTPKPLVDGRGNQVGNQREPTSDATGNQRATRSGARGTSVTPEPVDNTDPDEPEELF